MKIGAENKKQVRWMIALLVIALLVGIYNFVDFWHQFRRGARKLQRSDASRRNPARPKWPIARLIPDCVSTSWPPART